MKLSILTVLGAFALAGAALAGSPPIGIASDFEGATSAPTAYDQLHPARDEPLANILRAGHNASSQVRVACAADREKLCADAKTTFSAGRCLERHRRDINVACAVALSQATLAWSAPR